MKKIVLSFIVFAFVANVSAQLKVNSSGDIYIGSSASNFLGTTATNIPITFKLGTTYAGFTGSSVKTNVSFGYGSLNSGLLTGGVSNVAVGVEALYSNSGSNNTANGYRALYSNDLGHYNTANGSCALRNNNGSANTSAGYYNTANGANSLYSNSSGYNNTANGYQALYNNTIGYNNTAIGAGADVYQNYFTNATAIGYNAKATASDQVRIGNTSVTSIVGGTNWVGLSDGRAKKNIRAEVPGLAFVNQLQPVMYNFDLDALDELERSDDPKINAFNDSVRNARSPEEKAIEAKSRAKKERIVYSGFIAQDVEKAAQSVGYDFSGVDAPENGKGAYGLRYAEFVVPLVKAVQELSEQNARLQEQIDELKKNNASLRSAANETETIGIANTTIGQCKLYQNAPNPFTQNTQIRFYIPDEIKTALLCIYNLQGSQIKQIVVTGRGEGSQWISGSELSAGIYLYALIVDGKEVDTKRMILTK